ncbi:putative Clathrin heavy chain 1 [Blattamonas nauphoetae]|uniref:Clathrin heavy chain n=1 Tax=Blattamonas nauphoetae TaxID=2049346 RepID=A0ABQ9YA38_9EUKA|nr:putative Clathrin heavy chain 1 [Blattamonas nauphoetae]
MQVPVDTKQVIDLKTVVSDPSLISFGQTCLSSDTALCCQNVVDGAKFVISLNPRNPSEKGSFKMKADLVAPHPKRKILALKGGNDVQVYDVELSSRLRATKVNENVELMRWIDLNTLVLVTTTAVYHWSLDGDAQPQLVFNRRAELNGMNIVNYRTDTRKNWCVLLASTVDPATRRLTGALQIHNCEKNKSQFAPAHTGMYVQAQMDGRREKTNVFCMAVGNKVVMTEVDNTQNPVRVQGDIIYTDPNDVPIAMQYSERFGLLLVISAMGILSGFDITTGTLVVMSKVSNSPIFTSVSEDTDNGIFAINTAGQVLHITINTNTLIPFITQKMKDTPLAIRIAARANLGGTDELFTEQFEQQFSMRNYMEAARIVTRAPNNALRTQHTLQRFKQAQPMDNQPPPIVQYLGVIMDAGKLNEFETLELCMPMIQSGQKAKAEEWMRQGKITPSEELGNFVRQFDRQFALAIYLSCKSHANAVQIMCELGEFEKVVQYCKMTEYKAPFSELIRVLAGVNPAGAASFAKLLIKEPSGPLADPGEIMEIFYQRDLIKELTDVIYDYLTKNDPSMSRLQTRYLEILLQKNTQAADFILGKKAYDQYDPPYIASCCEQAGLYHRALEHYTEKPDILRCIVYTNKIPHDFIIAYIHEVTIKVDRSYGYECIKALVKNKTNLNLVVEICKRCMAELGASELIEILEQGGMVEGVYLFLQGVASQVQDKDIVFRFIQAAVKMGQFKDVERVVRESNAYDPKQVKDFLKESKGDPQALIIVCDKHDYIEELIKYLYQNNFHKAIERYCTGYNPKATPKVVGALIDCEANEEFINALLGMVKNECPIPPLVEECEARNKLRILQPFLEARVTEDGNTEPACHSALAMIYVESNKGADQFLSDNQYYDPLVVGKYCEKRDPRRAVLCYRKGNCDEQMIDLTNRNQLFKEQAKYLVERKNPELWATVLNEENPYRRQLIDQVNSTALPNSKEVEEVTTTVKAFMTAELPSELIELLEVIVLRKSEFASIKKLQNLLLITAIKAESPKVKDYIYRLDNYDGEDVAKFAVISRMYEEAFEIYKRFEKHEAAMGVLIDHIGDIERANDLAVTVNLPSCWTLLAKGELARDMVEKCISSYIKADDPSDYQLVINAAVGKDLYDHLVNYLRMARRLKEQVIDSELVYSFARTDQLAEIEEFIGQSNLADLQAVGDRCYDEEMYNAARILFNHIGNYGKLAQTLVRLHQYQPAVEAARKAQSIRTWKEVCFACVDARQFRLAQMCGVNIVVQVDELATLIDYYTERGHYDEIIQLMEYALRLEHTHMGMFTELGILYSKYKPEKLMEHIKMFHSRINIPQLLGICEANLQWAELCLLHTHYDDFDKAAQKMLEHIDAWSHSQFKDIVIKVTNTEILYRAIDAYLQQHPLLVCDLLTVMSPQLDHSRVVQQLRRKDRLALCKPFLLFVQGSVKPEVPEVNEAVNELYVEEEDVDALRLSIAQYPSFDQLGLARNLEKHHLLRMRRVASLLFTQNKRFAHAVELAKKDKMYQDAMEASAASKDVKVCEELLRFLANDIDENERAGCFAAALYICFEFLTEDIVMEVAWEANLEEYAKPFQVQQRRNSENKINELEKTVMELKKKLEAKEEEEKQAKVTELQQYPPQMTRSQGMVSTMGAPMNQPMNMPMNMPMGGSMQMGGQMQYHPQQQFNQGGYSSGF